VWALPKPLEEVGHEETAAGCGGGLATETAIGVGSNWLSPEEPVHQNTKKWK